MGKCLFMRKGEIHSEPKVGLPSGYTELSYIQSSGTQYIDTGFKPNQDTSVVMDFAVTSVSATSWLFCGRTAANNSAFGLYTYSSSGKFYAVYGTKQYTFSTVANLARQHCDFDKNTVDVAGETYVFEEQSFESSATLYLLARNTGGTIAGQASAKLYTCKIYDNGTLIRDFVPCINPNGEIGLYDTVNKKFYGNAGTGAFRGDPDVTGDIMASDLAVGSSVYLNENGSPVEYLVINQGIPSNSSSYDSSCNGTWLLRKDIYEKRQWHSSNNSYYQNSTIHSYLNSTFFGMLDSTVQSIVKEVKIPHSRGQSNDTVYTDSNGLTTKVFLLAGREVYDTSSSQVTADGAKVSYFSSKSQRIAYLNGTATQWWLRTPYKGVNGQAWYIETDGGNALSQYCSSAYGIRPALIIQSNSIFDVNTLVPKGVA